MSGRRSEGSAESGSVGSSRGSTWQERRQKKREDRERQHKEEQSSLREGSYQMNRAVSDASGHRQLDERDEELERLRKLVRDLELEARGRHQKRDRDNQADRSMTRGDRYSTKSNRSSSHRYRDCSHSRESCRCWDHCIHESPDGIGNVHVHGSIKAEVRIPQRSDSPVMQPWML